MSRSEQAHDAAAAWIIRRENSDWSEQDQAAFDGWLAESDGNRAAYWRLKHSWNEADRIGSLGMRADDIPAGRRVTPYWTPALAADIGRGTVGTPVPHAHPVC